MSYEFFYCIVFTEIVTVFTFSGTVQCFVMNKKRFLTEYGPSKDEEINTNKPGINN